MKICTIYELIEMIKKGTNPKIIETLGFKWLYNHKYQDYERLGHGLTDNDYFFQLLFKDTVEPFKQKIKFQTELLDNEEKEYLKSIIKPFRNRIKYLHICEKNSNIYYIEIVLKDIEEGYDYLNLPNFNKGSMYKKLDIEKHYTLEELGL